MSLADAPAPRTLPPIPLDLDEPGQSRLKAAWEFVAMHGVETTVVDRVRAAADAATANPITIAFGGHWSAGKSTLINALLGRNLLPVSERTETGVACRIRAGLVDEALAIRSGLSVVFPCTREAIAEHVSITGGGAKPRSEIAAIEAVELTLAHAPLPPNVCWIDTPGLNDSVKGDERLKREADRTDLLLWILNPDQPLSEVEQQFLADHVDRRGIDSVALLVNVRTHRQPAADWRRFLDEASRAHYAKIERFWDVTGVAKSPRPPVLIASAAHLRDEFGAREVLDFLDGSDGRLAGRVVSTRIAALMAVVAVAASEIERRAEELRVREEQQRIARAERQRWLSVFREAVIRDAFDVVSDVREKLRAVGAQRAGIMPSSSAQAEASVGVMLRSEMHRLVLERWNVVLKSVHDAAARTGMGAPSQAALNLLAADLAVPAVRILPPAIAPTGGCAIGLWGCAGPLAAFLLFAALVSESSGPLFLAAIVCVVVAFIVSGNAGRQRARDLPRRVDEAILAAAGAYTMQIQVAVDHLIEVYDTTS